jgi:hypothetical protein
MRARKRTSFSFSQGGSVTVTAVDVWELARDRPDE